MAGAVRLDGVDLRELDAAWFRSQIGVVSQVRRACGVGGSQEGLRSCSEL